MLTPLKDIGNLLIDFCGPVHCVSKSALKAQNIQPLTCTTRFCKKCSQLIAAGDGEVRLGK